MRRFEYIVGLSVSIECKSSEKGVLGAHKPICQKRALACIGAFHVVEGRGNHELVPAKRQDGCPSACSFVLQIPA